MAKYTELLAEYLENGGQLPAVFDQIEGFKDLFVGEFIDCEIGYETDNLFSIKLNTRAELVIPPYKERIEAIAAAVEEIKNPTKTRIKTGNITRTYGEKQTTQNNAYGEKQTTQNNAYGEKQTTQNNAYGERTGATAEEPFNVQPATPSAFDNPATVTTNKEYSDKLTATEQARTDTVTATEQARTDTVTATEQARTDTVTATEQARTDTVTDTEQEHTDTETYNAVTETETGFTSSEAEALFKSLESEVFIIKRQLLREFDNLFMRVY